VCVCESVCVCVCVCVCECIGVVFYSRKFVKIALAKNDLRVLL
jgi:hypothetical protein